MRYSHEKLARDTSLPNLTQFSAEVHPYLDREDFCPLQTHLQSTSDNCDLSGDGGMASLWKRNILLRGKRLQIDSRDEGDGKYDAFHADDGLCADGIHTLDYLHYAFHNLPLHAANW